MSRALLDINVLIALLDSDHADHDRAREWAGSELAEGWSSCAITQNGFVRIISQERYPSPVPTSEAIRLLASATSTPHHEFWPCSVTILEEATIDRERLHGPRQVTDAYLLALAVEHRGRFATFDQAVPLSAVPAATGRHLAVI